MLLDLGFQFAGLWFDVNSKTDSIRLGEFSVVSSAGVTGFVETPGCIIYARSGNVPHLTHSCLEEILDGPTVWHVPISSIIEKPGVNIISEFGKPYAEFAGVKKHVLCMSVHDSLCEKPDVYKYNEEKSVSVWAPGGRCKISSGEYALMVKIFGFDACIAPSDQIQTEHETAKRCKKSYERSLRFLHELMMMRDSSGQMYSIIGCIEGGDDVRQREECAEEVCRRNVDAFMASGLDYAGDKWKQLAAVCLKYMPDDAARMMFGVFSPEEVVQAVEMGMDVFDTVTPVHATERGCALVFSFSAKKPCAEDGLQNDGNIPLKTDDGVAIGSHSEIMPVGISSETSGRIPVFIKKDLSRFEIDLNDAVYLTDSQPLVKSCSCYCCRRHGRAYVHHLLVTKEMLAQVLLMMHNLHHWLQFFKEMRSSIKEKRFQEFKKIVMEAI